VFTSLALSKGGGDVEIVRGMLCAGNSKLGEALLHFDVPAGVTCPGKSNLCYRRCYARRNRFAYPQVRERLQWCYEMSKRRDFAKLMIQEIRRKGAAFVVRVHCAGDLYSAAYTRKWIEVIRSSPNTRFFLYSRSWRAKAIFPSLVELASLQNCRLWFSADDETGYPPEVPPGVRVAWMQVSEEEEIPDVELIFRDYPLRKERQPMIGLSLVCPHEQPVDRDRRTNCGVCGYCWKH
jgi:Gene product 88